MIMGNVTFGLIVDTFGSLRDETYKYQYDKKNICFICQLSRDGCLLKKIDYETHIKKNHNLWSYIDFLCYLHLYNANDFSRVENLVWEKLLNVSEIKKTPELYRSRLYELLGWKLRYCIALTKEKNGDYKKELIDTKKEFVSLFEPYRKECGNKFVKLSFVFMKMPPFITLLYFQIIGVVLEARKHIRILRTSD